MVICEEALEKIMHLILQCYLCTSAVNIMCDHICYILCGLVVLLIFATHVIWITGENTSYISHIHLSVHVLM